MAGSGIGGVLLHQTEYGNFFFVLEVNEVDRKGKFSYVSISLRFHWLGLRTHWFRPFAPDI